MTLGDLCDLVAGRVTLVLELKSRFDGDLRIAARAAAVLAVLRRAGRRRLVRPGADLRAAADRAAALPAASSPSAIMTTRNGGISAPPASFELAFLMHGWKSRPDFIAYRVGDLTAVAPRVARHMFGLPLLTWTVRSDEDRAIAAAFRRPDHLRGISPLTMTRKPAAAPETHDLRIRVIPAIVRDRGRGLGSLRRRAAMRPAAPIPSRATPSWRRSKSPNRRPRAPAGSRSISSPRAPTAPSSASRRAI